MATTREVKQIPLRLPPEVYNRVKNLAFFSETSMNDVICRAVIQFLDTTGDTEQAVKMAERARAEYRPVLDKLRDL